MSRQRTLWDIDNDTGSQGSVGGRLPVESQAFQTTSGSTQVPVHASRGLAQAKDGGPQTLAIYGPTCCDSSFSADLQCLLESKLKAALDVNGSRECVLTWSQWDMEWGGGDLCAASVGSTCIRQRLYWGAVEHIRNPVHQGLEGHAGNGDCGEEPRWIDSIPRGPVPSADVWSDFVVGRFRSDKWRRVESGVKPLVYGLSSGMGRDQPELRRMARSAGKNRKTRLMAYGNAICPQLAAVFIRSFLESVQELR